MKSFHTPLIIYCLFLFFLVSCAAPEIYHPPAENLLNPPSEQGSPFPVDNDFWDDWVFEPPLPDLLPPNELGDVMILMYHNIGQRERHLIRTPESFRQDLEELYSRGYRTVPLLDYVRGEMDLPAGTSPVILTFDDSTKNQFHYILTGDSPVLDPNCAVGILEDFYRQHPDFGRAATFYINWPSFAQKGYGGEKLEFLRQEGYEIGNHTYNHPFLNKISDGEVRMQIGLLARKVAEALPGYEMKSLSLPYGVYPANTSLVVRGKYRSVPYEHEAVLKAGGGLAPSPFSTRFKPMGIPRIEANPKSLAEWLNYFDEHPERRYVSDGDPLTVTVPGKSEKQVKKKALGERELVLLERD